MYQQNDNPWQNQERRYDRPQRRRPKNSMATAALVCSMLSIITICTFYGAIIFGALAILFALLSRGSQKRVSGQAKGNIILSLVAIIISLVIILGTVAYVFTTFGSIDNFYNYYIESLEENGVSSDILEQYGLTDGSESGTDASDSGAGTSDSGSGSESGTSGSGSDSSTGFPAAESGGESL